MLLDIKNLTVSFDTSTGPFKAVDGIDITVNKGEVLAIVGESGSGKSVGMLAVMGLLPKTATVTADVMMFDGMDLRTLSDSQRRKIIGRDISMIFQEPVASLNPCFTVGYQLEEVLKQHMGMGASASRARAIELLELVGIRDAAERLKSFPHQMSGGQCQRVMIAIAIACNPKLLIADEPTTALDVTIQKQILDLLMRLQVEHGMGLIMITHEWVWWLKRQTGLSCNTRATRWKMPTCCRCFPRPSTLTPVRCSRPCRKMRLVIVFRRFLILSLRISVQEKRDERDRSRGARHQARLSCWRRPVRQAESCSCRQGGEFQGRKRQDAGDCR
ncbi:peptide/nickel transport system ATP-binding protein [Brucella sp. NVSL 07-0026]|nr:peptide/nickel transport system ATP-binding protein [Brucella sp. NVSL 07-0026]